MFGGLRSHFGSGVEPTAGYAFQLQNNLSHLLFQYPELSCSKPGDVLQAKGSTTTLVERVKPRWVSGSDIPSTSHKDVPMNAEHILPQGTVVHANHKLVAKRHTNKGSVDSSDVDIVENEELPSSLSLPYEDSTADMESLFGEDCEESNNDSTQSEPFLGNPHPSTSILPLQPIHNSSPKSCFKLSKPNSASSATQPQLPIPSSLHPTSPSAPHHVLSTTKNLSKKRQKPDQPPGQPLSKHTRIQGCSSSKLPEIEKQDIILREPLLHPSLPITKIVTLGWINEITRMKLFLSNGWLGVKEAKFLAGILKAIWDFREHIPDDQVPNLVGAIKDFKHRSDFDVYQLSIKSMTRDILGYWGKKLFGRDIRSQIKHSTSRVVNEHEP